MRVPRMRWFVIVLVALLAAAARASTLATVPDEIASSHFVVTINGQATPVMHAAVNLYFLNFAASRKMTISVTADTDDFWAKGVEVQPWRLGIRPQRNGRTITFRLDGAAKISISRPGDYLGNAEMLYLFANAPEAHPPLASGTGLRYFGPGVHHDNIDANTGDNIYLAPGAVVFGALNVWGVQHVKVFGRGVIVYDGPQNPADDDGWMHKRNWHCIVMDHAEDITIEGITCIVRSRTWQIQMKDSRGILFDNVKVIGANTGNANADGMDWLGGGDTIVRNSFFRAADDVFAMQSSWEGYGPVAFAVQGNPVTNITVEDSVLSTSISNIVRAGWPQKNFEGGHFLMRNSDVLHMGLGGCGIPFALMEIWADPAGRGQSRDFAFENIRLEDWYSLVQLQEPVEGIRDVRFTDVMGLELPSLVPSLLKGRVDEVSLDNTVLAEDLATKDTDVPLTTQAGAPEPKFSAGGPGVHITADAGWYRPGQRVHLGANPAAEATEGTQYDWTFGDGTHARGRKVSHKYRDIAGTVSDGSGRFRVLLHASTPAGRNTWVSYPVVVHEGLQPAAVLPKGEPGVTYRYGEQADATASQTAGQNTAAAASGIAAGFDLSAVPHRPANYSLSFEGDLDVPADGGYTFVVIGNDAARLDIDGVQATASREPFAQVCGLAGNAARAVTATSALAMGHHHIRVTETHGEGQDDFRVLWQGPDFSLRPIPATRLSHGQSPTGTTTVVSSAP